MNTYTVHLYREMRLTFTGIEAGSPEAAARIASTTHTDNAARLVDCEGSNLAAFVERDVEDDFIDSHAVYFDDGRFLSMGPRLLEALHAFVALGCGHRPSGDFWSDLELQAARARNLLREAKGRRPA